MGISDYITGNPPEDAQPITLEHFEKILEEAHQELPERPKDGEDIVLTELEQLHWDEFGQISRHYSDGSYVIYMSEDRREALLKALRG